MSRVEYGNPRLRWRKRSPRHDLSPLQGLRTARYSYLSLEGRRTLALPVRRHEFGPATLLAQQARAQEISLRPPSPPSPPSLQRGTLVAFQAVRPDCTSRVASTGLPPSIDHWAAGARLRRSHQPLSYSSGEGRCPVR